MIWSTCLFALPIHKGVISNAVQPCGHPAQSVKPANGLPHFDKGILGQILSCFSVFAKTVQDGVHPLIMRINELFRRAFVAQFYSLHKYVIVERVQSPPVILNSNI